MKITLRKLWALPFNKRRALLRKTFPLDAVTPPYLEEVLNSSPLIGDGPEQVKIAPTPSALRDALPCETLAIIATGLVELGDRPSSSPDEPPFHINAMLSAIKFPYVYGLKDSKSKTGYRLGYEKHWPSPESLGEQNWVVDVPDEEEPAPEEPSGAEEPPAKTSGYTPIAAEQSRLIDTVLAAVELPPINQLIDELNDATAKAEAAVSISMAKLPDKIEASGAIPDGRPTVKKAAEVFGLSGKPGFDFNVPTFEWDAPHPHVPVADEGYIFRPAELFRVLYAILTNQRAYLHGDTGTGKTTLIEQTAARLAWPFMRVNFDSEVTRADLMGRDTLSNEGGVTVSKFVDGILPQMMGGPYIGCFDELDFVRPDVAYVMQRALEGDGLMLTEDGGRMVRPHPLFRLFATGNTVGQGDEKGLYQGARAQSMALLDRFTVWVCVGYLNKKDRLKLIKKRTPALSKKRAEQISQYVTEHIEAFTTAKVLQPLSPRGVEALGNAIVHFSQSMPDEAVAVKQALECTVLDRATEQDRAVLSGIADRVFV